MSKAVVPRKDLSHNLGTKVKRWGNVHAGNIHAGNVIAGVINASAAAGGLQADIDSRATKTEVEALIAAHSWFELKRSTAYAVGDVAFSPNLPSWAYLVCTQAGTTGETEPVFGGGGVTPSYPDGTVIWQVRDSRCRYTVGEIVAKMGAVKDYDHLLLCDGSTISETDYPELVAMLGGTQLPNLMGRVLQGDSVGGAYKAPGLPNISAYIGKTEADTSGLPSGACWCSYVVYNNTWADQAYAGDSLQFVHFSAALYNAIYGASTTVQPPAYTTRIYICYG